MRLELPALDEELGRAIRGYATKEGQQLELFRIAACNPAVLTALRVSTRSFLRDGLLDVRTRELLILRSTRRASAEAEWAVHVNLFAEQAGLRVEDLDRLAAVEFDDVGRDGALVRLVDELFGTRRVSEDLARELVAWFAPAEIVEMVGLVAQYLAVSLLSTAFDIQVPPGLRGFDGLEAGRPTAAPVALPVSSRAGR